MQSKSHKSQYRQFLQPEKNSNTQIYFQALLLVFNIICDKSERNFKFFSQCILYSVSLTKHNRYTSCSRRRQR